MTKKVSVVLVVLAVTSFALTAFGVAAVKGVVLLPLGLAFWAAAELIGGSKA